MNDMPKRCNHCSRECGGREMLVAWALYDDEGSYWLCDRCYQVQVVIPAQRLAKEAKKQG